MVGSQLLATGDWKAIKLDVLTDEAELLLFNLSEDLAEIHNLADDRPEILEELILQRAADAQHRNHRASGRSNHHNRQIYGRSDPVYRPT